MSADPRAAMPWYRPVAHEVAVFEHAYDQQLPLMLKGPTGCGKSRLVEHLAAKRGRPLITVACHDDTSAADLLGRWLIRGGDTVWQDGPVTRAVREGAILYIDEVAEARPDVVVVLHPLTDHRREIYLDRIGETVKAAEGFMLVVSYNPGYQRNLKEMKPSTRQRFVSVAMDYPPAAVEQEIVLNEAGGAPATAKRLVALAAKMRALDQLGLAEVPSTRLLVDTAKLVKAGLPPRLACQVGLVEPLSDERDVVAALMDLVNMVF